MRVERLDLDEWESALPSGGHEVFHRPEALRVIDDHTPHELQLYGGFKGEQPIALFPAFVRERSVGVTVTSPPPGMNIPQLGPVLMPTSPKRRKQEKINKEFTDEVLDRVGAEESLTLIHMVCADEYTDPRPYVWNDLSVQPYFTYALDVDGDTDAIMKNFSKSLRREIRNARDTDVEITVEGVEAAAEVHRNTKERYEEQGDEHPVSWRYVRDLIEALDDRARTYVARTPDGEFLSGVTALYSDDAAYFWQGGARATYEGESVNSLIHWNIIEDIAAGEPIDSVSQYDLMGANTERLCRYKAKFGADLVTYYIVETSSPAMDVAKRAYRALHQ